MILQMRIANGRTSRFAADSNFRNIKPSLTDLKAARRLVSLDRVHTLKAQTMSSLLPAFPFRSLHEHTPPAIRRTNHPWRGKVLDSRSCGMDLDRQSTRGSRENRCGFLGSYRKRSFYEKAADFKVSLMSTAILRQAQNKQFFINVVRVGLNVASKRVQDKRGLQAGRNL